MRLLWFVPKPPYPPDDGARIASYNLIRGLTELGVAIDLIYLSSDIEEATAKKIKEILNLNNVYPLFKEETSAKTRIQSLLQYFSKPLTLVPYGNKHIADSVLTLVNNNFGSWDYIVYDGLHTASHSMINGRFRKLFPDSKIIYRAHNCETDIWRRKVEGIKLEKNRASDLCKNFFLKELFKDQARRVAVFEQSLIEHSSRIFTVSTEDSRALAAMLPAKYGKDITLFHTVPIGYAMGEPMPQGAENTFLFLGKLDWLPNKEGLQWFLENVWFKVIEIRKELKLIIAGSGNSSWMNAYIPHPSIDFKGRVDDVREVYARSVASIVPVFFGSGTRVKAIESSRYGIPCISTRIGVEGIGLVNPESYFNAETKEEWAEVILGTSAEGFRNVGLRAYSHIKEEFDYKNCARKFLENC